MATNARIAFLHPSKQTLRRTPRSNSIMRLPDRSGRDIPAVVALILGCWLSSVTLLQANAVQARTNVTVKGEGTPTPNYDDFFTNLKRNFAGHQAGCLEPEGPTGLYQWTVAGYGSNINRFMVHWLRSVVQGQIDMAVINAYNHIGAFFYVWCLEESGGVVTERGWSCIFEDMPHLCIFSEEKVLLDYLHSHQQSWLKRDIELVLEEPEIAPVSKEAFVGMHVRRGDKLVHEARRHEVEEYLSGAASALRQGVAGNGTSSDCIKGIWVSSDDPTVISELKQLAADFFPNVGEVNIIWISSRAVSGIPNRNGTIPTATYALTYDSFVTWFAELRMLAKADIFVGTFSSNVSRMMLLMREANGLPRNTTISVDRLEWSPGRRLDRRI